VKFIDVTFSPKNTDHNKLEADRDLSKMATVASAKAIDNGTPFTFLLTASSEKIIRTRISPISVSVSVRTLNSTDFWAE
jgi:hypothetical protein